MVAYTVTCEFTDAAVAEQWIAWLRDEHVAEVCAAGALDAAVIRVDVAREAASGGGARSIAARVEVRYHFASREAFRTYERDHAPRLRAAGLKRFPPERGLIYTRSIGDVVIQFDAPAG